MGKKEREYVLGRYSSPKWKARVKNMSDEQVVAIYLRMKAEESKKSHDEKRSTPEDPQGTLF